MKALDPFNLVHLHTYCLFLVQGKSITVSPGDVAFL